jgi:transcriptional regulator with XRE-family HTH domain
MQKRDLRELNDRNFERIYRYLDKKTSGFTSLYEKLILENNHHLLIFRVILGMSQKEFAEKLGKTKDNIRHIEAKRRIIVRSEIVQQYADKINSIFSKKIFNLEDAMKNWKNYTFYSKDQNISDPEIKFKTFLNMNEVDLVSYYKLIKRETNNFKTFTPDLLIRIPQSLTIFRIVLCLSFRRLSKILEMDYAHLRIYEHLKNKMKPLTAKRIILKIENLFKKTNVDSITTDKILENFRILSGFYGNRNLDSLIDQGLNRLAKINPTRYEEKISDVLENKNIKFERYRILEGIKKRFNIDFFVPDKQIAIEVFSYSDKQRKNLKSKTCLVDHRFQSLKLKNPKTKTIICMEVRDRPILYEYFRRYISTGLLNTDYLLINKDVHKLPNIINKIKVTTQ